MTEQEKRDLKAHALLRYHDSKCEVACYKTRIEEFKKQLEAASRVLNSNWDMEVLVIDNQRIVRSRQGEAIYPSMDDLASIVESHRKAVSEMAAAQRECQSLGLAT